MALALGRSCGQPRSENERPENEPTSITRSGAKRASNEIDLDVIVQEEAAEILAVQGREPIRVLLVGQSGSGKSMLLDYLSLISEYHMTFRWGSSGLQKYIFCIIQEILTIATGPSGMASLYAIDFIIYPFIDEYIPAVSHFNEYLTENHSSSRLEGSLFHWKSICSSSLLQKIPIILLFSKSDLLQKNWNYGDRPNDIEIPAQQIRRYKSLLFSQSSGLHALNIHNESCNRNA
ncbi:hypothetical protein CPB84DRAFT_1765551 [Gymnopilus junonius]|uniref:Uncharacterized protein n=1 Tax=Gymnopilus junonius TaxID=109634 RepID=A0A9P5NVA5_GYMJU|nr:hypothetical protein CPB84DRAFT_1765551 [Gymnopilus junonius]